MWITGSGGNAACAWCLPVFGPAYMSAWTWLLHACSSTSEGGMSCWLTEIDNFSPDCGCPRAEPISLHLAKAIKSWKSWGCFEFALQRSFWSSEGGGRVVSELHSCFSCFTLAATSLWGEKCSVVWPRDCTAQPQNSARVIFHSWNVTRGWLKQCGIKNR